MLIQTSVTSLQNMKKELSAGERVLQAIEKEAVVQTILKKLADVLNPQESQMIGEVCAGMV